MMDMIYYEDKAKKITVEQVLSFFYLFFFWVVKVLSQEVKVKREKKKHPLPSYFVQKFSSMVKGVMEITLFARYLGQTLKKKRKE